MLSATNKVNPAVAPVKQFENGSGPFNGSPIETVNSNQMVETVVLQDKAGAGLQKGQIKKRTKTDEEQNDHTIKPNRSDNAVKMHSDDGLTRYTCSYGEDYQAIAPLITDFMSMQDYKKRLGIFNNLMRTDDKVRSLGCLLNSELDNSFRGQLLYFLDDMKKNDPDNLGEEEHIAVLSHVLREPSIPEFLRSLVFDQLVSYISNKNINLYKAFLSTGSNNDLLMEFRIFFIQEVLEQGICEKSVIQSSLMIIKDDHLELQTRDEILELFFAACNIQEGFEDAVTALAVDSDLEWALKIKAVQRSNRVSSASCFNTIVHHLLSFFSRETRWHIRDAAVWTLADTPKGCDGEIISHFFQFVQDSSDHIGTELLDFRHAKIKSIIWSLVRLGIRNENNEVVSHLKSMAMNYKMNVYFRVMAVEALRDLSIYVNSAAQALYEIVRDNKRREGSSQSGFITDDQEARDRSDKEVTHRALDVLAELLTAKQEKFFSFRTGSLDYGELYRRKAFDGQTIPEELDAYIRPVLGRLIKDERVDHIYRDWARKVLN